MQQLELRRITQNSSLPQIGMLLYKEQPFVLTLELPWADNLSEISCIPTGKYLCKKVTNRKLTSDKIIPITFEVENVPDRTGILFHTGNSLADTKGCILIGLKLSVSYTQKELLLNSVEGFNKFLSLTKDVSIFELEVK